MFFQNSIISLDEFHRCARGGQAIAAAANVCVERANAKPSRPGK
jgi:hypothetical protein